MNSLLKIHSVLFALTFVSAAAPALAITRVGNSEGVQVTQRGNPDIVICCQPMIYPTNEEATSSETKISEVASSLTETIGSPVLFARDWFGWEREPQPKQASV